MNDKEKIRKARALLKDYFNPECDDPLSLIKEAYHILED